MFLNYCLSPSASSSNVKPTSSHSTVLSAQQTPVQMFSDHRLLWQYPQRQSHLCVTGSQQTRLGYQAQGWWPSALLHMSKMCRASPSLFCPGKNNSGPPWLIPLLGIEVLPPCATAAKSLWWSLFATIHHCYASESLWYITPHRLPLVDWSESALAILAQKSYVNT